MARGQLMKNPNGTYTVRVDLVPDPVTGKRRRRQETYRLRKEAERRLSKWLAEVERGTALAPSKLTVGELLDTWVTDIAPLTAHSRTVRDYRATINNHLKPALGEIPVQKLTAAKVQAFYTDKLAAGASPRTVELCHLRLAQALKQAVHWGIVPVSIMDRVRKPRVTYKRFDVWSPEEGSQFLRTAAHDALWPLWHVALATGMRRGELLGIRWRDVDLERGTLSVVQVVIVNADGAPEIKPTPKTEAGRRTIKLDAETVAELQTHRRRWLARQINAASWAHHDLIFCTRTGGPLNPNNIIRSYTAVVNASGVRPIRFHDLRHTHATWLLQA